MVSTRIQPEMLKRLDEWRREQPDLPSRPEALRRLAEQALARR
jgi:metal-responsive CopG/Arc/MetJ family transcriptional regulator